MSELLPCPFCNSIPKESANGGIRCSNHNCLVGYHKLSFSPETWNTRVHVPSPWISVEERLPEVPCILAIWWKDENEWVFEFCEEDNMERAKLLDVRFWQPLPIPPLEPTEKKE